MIKKKVQFGLFVIGIIVLAGILCYTLLNSSLANCSTVQDYEILYNETSYSSFSQQAEQYNLEWEISRRITFSGQSFSCKLKQGDLLLGSADFKIQGQNVINYMADARFAQYDDPSPLFIVVNGELYIATNFFNLI